MKRKRGTEVPRHTEWRKVMTMDEVAEYLRVHRTTIYRLIKRHKIPVMADEIRSAPRFRPSASAETGASTSKTSTAG